MKKRILKAIILIVLSTVCFVCFFGCNFQKSEYEIARSLIERNSKVELPMDSEIIYHLRDKEKKFQGIGFQYTVFQMENEPTNWLNENSFEASIDEYNNKRFELFFLSALSEVPDRVGEIPQELLPNFDEQFYYLKTDNVYFVYIPQDLLLITMIPSN